MVRIALRYSGMKRMRVESITSDGHTSSFQVDLGARSLLDELVVEKLERLPSLNRIKHDSSHRFTCPRGWTSYSPCSTKGQRQLDLLEARLRGPSKSGVLPLGTKRSVREVIDLTADSPVAIKDLRAFCPACQLDIANQEAHYGGCLQDPNETDEEFYSRIKVVR